MRQKTQLQHNKNAELRDVSHFCMLQAVRGEGVPLIEAFGVDLKKLEPERGCGGSDEYEWQGTGTE